MKLIAIYLAYVILGTGLLLLNNSVKSPFFCSMIISIPLTIITFSYLNDGEK